MLILRNPSPIPTQARGSVLALGNFDGLHLGHKAVIDETLRLAENINRPASVMTFEPHPRRVFRPELPSQRIYAFRQKAQLIANHGIRFLRVVRFTKVFSQMPAEPFVETLLRGDLQVSHVVTGDDFRFGANREGDADLLRQLAAKHGFGYTACAPVMLGSVRCSSTHIRDLLAHGDMEKVGQMLGRPYSIMGHVRHGDKRGRELGYPTANIVPYNLYPPANGIYAVRANVRGQWVDGVASLGTRPTFNGKGIVLEVYLFDWGQDIYGERLEVVFFKRLRDELKFKDIETLKAQMAEDCERAKQMLAHF